MPMTHLVEDGGRNIVAAHQRPSDSSKIEKVTEHKARFAPSYNDFQSIAQFTVASTFRRDVMLMIAGQSVQSKNY